MKKILAFIFVFVMACMMTSCKSVQPTIIHDSVHDTCYVNKFFRDTIYHQDSVFMVMELRGDTVFKEKVQYKYIYKEHTRIDTTYISHTDTATITKTIVTNELTKWQKMQISFGRSMLVAMLIAMIVLCFKIKG